jgi:histidine triad (HIT) family protein
MIKGEVPCKKIFDDELAFAFEDIRPQAPTHILVVPKKHIRGLKEAQAQDSALVGHCHLVAAQIARERNIEDGYRTVLNVGPNSGQSVFHLHVHLLGGRHLKWPPG